MIASVLILSVSLILFAYWFRYTCVLVLRANEAVWAGNVAARNQLNFLRVRELLAHAADLDALERSLEKDYRLLSFLLAHSAKSNPAGIEQRMLVLDYRLMRVWYLLVRRSSLPRARAALAEMAGILEYLADRMGAYAAQSSAVA